MSISVFVRLDGKLARYHMDTDDHNVAINALEEELIKLDPRVPRSAVLALFERVVVDQPMVA